MDSDTKILRELYGILEMPAPSDERSYLLRDVQAEIGRRMEHRDCDFIDKIAAHPANGKIRIWSANWQRILLQAIQAPVADRVKACWDRQDDPALIGLIGDVLIRPEIRLRITKNEFLPVNMLGDILSGIFEHYSADEERLRYIILACYRNAVRSPALAQRFAEAAVWQTSMMYGVQKLSRKILLPETLQMWFVLIHNHEGLKAALTRLAPTRPECMALNLAYARYAAHQR